jgi:hypothetical protein
MKFADLPLDLGVFLLSTTTWAHHEGYRLLTSLGIPGAEVTTMKKWSELGPRKRKLIVAAGVGEACLKAAMLMDLRHRGKDQVRGPKWLWTPLAFVNLVGPLSYFAIGRRWQWGCSHDR